MGDSRGRPSQTGLPAPIPFEFPVGGNLGNSSDRDDRLLAMVTGDECASDLGPGLDRERNRDRDAQSRRPGSRLGDHSSCLGRSAHSSPPPRRGPVGRAAVPQRRTAAAAHTVEDPSTGPVATTAPRRDRDVFHDTRRADPRVPPQQSDRLHPVDERAPEQLIPATDALDSNDIPPSTISCRDNPNAEVTDWLAVEQGARRDTNRECDRERVVPPRVVQSAAHSDARAFASLSWAPAPASGRVGSANPRRRDGLASASICGDHPAGAEVSAIERTFV